METVGGNKSHWHCNGWRPDPISPTLSHLQYCIVMCLCLLTLSWIILAQPAATLHVVMLFKLLLTLSCQDCIVMRRSKLLTLSFFSLGDGHPLTGSQSQTTCSLIGTEGALWRPLTFDKHPTTLIRSPKHPAQIGLISHWNWGNGKIGLQMEIQAHRLMSRIWMYWKR